VSNIVFQKIFDTLYWEGSTGTATRGFHPQVWVRMCLFQQSAGRVLEWTEAMGEPNDLIDSEDRDENGRFVIGHRQLAPSRAGKPNKITKALRERVLDGFNDPNDPNGDGITTFVTELKRDFPPAAAGLLARIMPPHAEETPTIEYTRDILIVSVPSGLFFTKEAAADDYKFEMVDTADGPQLTDKCASEVFLTEAEASRQFTEDHAADQAEIDKLNQLTGSKPMLKVIKNGDDPDQAA
jgi:hypothetical protein